MYLYGKYQDNEEGMPSLPGPIIPHQYTDSGSFICNLTNELPAVATRAAVTMGPKTKDAIRSLLPKETTLEGGPYDYVNMKTPWHTDDFSAAIYATPSAVPAHIDEAGITVGLVLINEGGHELVVNNRSWPLIEGGLFHIDSDLAHETRSLEEGLFVFAAIDFGWNRSRTHHVTYQNIADEIMLGLTRVCMRENAIGAANEIRKNTRA